MRSKNPYLFVFCLLTFFKIEAQTSDSWCYFRAHDTVFNRSFKQEGDCLVYTGNDLKLKSDLENYIIKFFIKTYKQVKNENLKKTFLVIDDQEEILYDVLENA